MKPEASMLDQPLFGKSTALGIVNTIDAEEQDPAETAATPRPVLSLANLPFVSPDDMQDHGFPYNVPTELTEAEGREVEQIINQEAPEWVRELRARVGR